MFMLYKIEARLSHAQVRVSRTLEGFFKQYYLNLINIIINIILKKVVNLISLHKSAYLSVGCIGNESVNKIWDRFLFIFTLRYGKKKSVYRVLFIFHVVLASILLRKRKFCYKISVWNIINDNDSY